MLQLSIYKLRMGEKGGISKKLWSSKVTQKYFFNREIRNLREFSTVYNSSRIMIELLLIIISVYWKEELSFDMSYVK